MYLFIQVTENCVSCGLNHTSVLEIPLLFMMFLCMTRSEIGVQWVFKFIGFVFFHSNNTLLVCCGFVDFHISNCVIIVSRELKR
jgi:hypothetical protein